ncbi:MAG: ATP-binding protein [Planctomycetes bacterium]|nr:ATP-binding protein [Planctomycetota bacterium]
MFDALVARTQTLIATAELCIPLTEQAFARAAMSRLSSRHRTTHAAGSLTFLSGPEGMGKSFLARSAIRDVRHQQPKLVAVIATAEELAEMLSAADEQQILADVLELFHGLHILVCDDLQVLEGRHQWQNLLLELVDQLNHNGTHVLFTCRKLPGELREFSPRWISRCHGGLCTTLPVLSRDSRIELLTRLAIGRRLPLVEPSELTFQWLADRWPVSPRELSALVERLVSHCTRRSVLVDVKFLERWFSESEPVENLSLDAIAAAVASEFGIEPAELRSRSRQPGLIVPRQCAMFLARELTGRPLEFIGHYFGERTHTTVSHSLSRLKELLPHAPTLRQQVQRLQKRIAELRREDCA